MRRHPFDDVDVFHSLVTGGTLDSLLSQVWTFYAVEHLFCLSCWLVMLKSI